VRGEKLISYGSEVSIKLEENSSAGEEKEDNQRMGK